MCKTHCATGWTEPNTSLGHESRIIQAMTRSVSNQWSTAAAWGLPREDHQSLYQCATDGQSQPPEGYHERPPVALPFLVLIPFGTNEMTVTISKIEQCRPKWHERGALWHDNGTKVVCLI